MAYFICALKQYGKLESPLCLPTHIPFPTTFKEQLMSSQVALMVTGYDLHLMCGHAVPAQMAHSACTG